MPRPMIEMGGGKGNGVLKLPQSDTSKRKGRAAASTRSHYPGEIPPFRRRRAPETRRREPQSNHPETFLRFQ